MSSEFYNEVLNNYLSSMSQELNELEEKVVEEIKKEIIVYSKCRKSEFTYSKKHEFINMTRLEKHFKELGFDSKWERHGLVISWKPKETETDSVRGLFDF